MILVRHSRNYFVIGNKQFYSLILFHLNILLSELSDGCQFPINLNVKNFNVKRSFVLTVKDGNVLLAFFISLKLMNLFNFEDGKFFDE